MFRNEGIVDMTSTVLHGTSAPVPSFQRVIPYGAGAVEAADERLLEEVKARRLARSQAKARHQAVRPAAKGQQVARTGVAAQHQPMLPIDRKLAKAQARREHLEEELKKAVEEEKTLERKKARMMESEKTKK
ncbi:hypothetical protein PtrSN002B_011375 [Pyrenophora tritici-repentis]|uniref:TT-ORF1 multi-domain protein n=2 Tax=Pyrenophora tritici-repentis TaxID=45151 RepID=A0A2W1DN32_9PLEO|nr:uncharacterized protein PTRG_12111 [Pyrenophora tritici-repentis Pt-1C-BFP]KAF7444207.1 hypothetical protein A1F99_107600 [Pyrenophora tritici-repentis]EDU47304.1 predicted protein [Pyrenophora tritici-repentis Pt-1C-BFP]KAF7565157.1 TT-ORF1 multi-domain protein [Pyrenophora tritici-repentis]KAI0604869.1 hypothetical protein TUN205_10882 [Pyrenophora tritici-repentis]KAI1508974.1 hypothetical protein Ptr86124_011930 [Pyrenophora tritici-repentis]